MTHHSEPGITVTGVGQSSASPDLMTVEIGISVLGTSVAEARSVAAERSAALIAYLKGSGIDDGDIQTVRYAIHPEYDHHEGQQRLRGYRVSNDVQVVLRQLGSAGEVLDSAADTGGDQVTINNVSFSVENQATARDQAREAAWEDARARAEHLARLSGRALGDVVGIVETSGRQPGPGPLPRMALATAETTPIEGGNTSITVSLEVRFALG
ncbi:MAG: SIMPL domain-containing protein [Acidimicrobiia bacterium]